MEASIAEAAGSTEAAEVSAVAAGAGDSGNALGSSAKEDGVRGTQ